MPHMMEDYIACLESVDRQLEEVLNRIKSMHTQFQAQIDCTFVFDTEHRYVFASWQGAKVLGFQPADMKGKHWRELGLSEEVMKPVEEQLSMVISSKMPVSSEIHINHPFQSTRYYEYNLYPFINAQGNVDGVIATFRNISARKLQEQQTYKHFYQWIQLIEYCPLGIIIVDEYGYITTVNPAFLKQETFINKTDLAGSHYREIAALFGIPYEQTAMSLALKGETVIGKYLKTDTHNFLINAFPIREFGSETIRGAIAIMDDITEYEKIHAEMMQLDRLNLVGEMAASVAHEVRNPMTVIKGYLQIFQKKIPNEMQEQVGLILKEINLVEVIISDFLSLARNNKSEQVNININTIIEDILPLIDAETIKRGMELQMNLADSLPELSLNEKEIKQLLFNLTQNAMDAMKKHGILTIETKQQEDNVLLIVADTGCGIGEQALDNIFKPFYTTKKLGTGLGLSVCKSIVEKHGGRIDVRSQIDVGTTFEIAFPA